MSVFSRPNMKPCCTKSSSHK